MWLCRDVSGHLAKVCVWGLQSSLVLSTELFPGTQLSQPEGVGIFPRGHLFSNLYRITYEIASAQVLVDYRRGITPLKEIEIHGSEVTGTCST